jgi:hypothetical protein
MMVAADAMGSLLQPKPCSNTACWVKQQMHVLRATSIHLSAASTAHALVQFAHHLLREAGSAAASHPCTQLVADAMGALEEHVWDVQLDPALLQAHSDAATKTEHVCCSSLHPVMCSEGLNQMFPGTQHGMSSATSKLADGIQTDADRQFMLVMALAVAGRAAVEIIDEGRLQMWLVAHAQRQGHLSGASDRAEQLMVLWRQCCTCQQPANVLAAAAQCMLACASKVHVQGALRFGPDSGMVAMCTARCG